MKRLVVPMSVAVSALAIGLFSRQGRFDTDHPHAGSLRAEVLAQGQAQDPIKIQKVSTRERQPLSKDSDVLTSRFSHPVTDKSLPVRAQSASRPVLSGAGSLASPTESPFTRVIEDGGPSIGTIRVLGHHGCDLNTQGWFLSVGNPEQYDFTISNDGETVVVEPNTSPPTGNFEFNHCVDPGQVVGKRVRFTVWIKAEGVTAEGKGQIARARVLGFDDRWQQHVFEGTDIKGTYDWKEFSIEADVGPEVTLFAYGVSFRSPGKLWIGHPKFGIAR